MAAEAALNKSLDDLIAEQRTKKDTRTQASPGEANRPHLPACLWLRAPAGSPVAPRLRIAEEGHAPRPEARRRAPPRLWGRATPGADPQPVDHRQEPGRHCQGAGEKSLAACPGAVDALARAPPLLLAAARATASVPLLLFTLPPHASPFVSSQGPRAAPLIVREEDPERRERALEGDGKWGHDLYTGPPRGAGGAGGRGRAPRGPKDPSALGTKL